MDQRIASRHTSRIERFMDIWALLVASTQLVFAAVGVLVMSFFAVVSEKGRLFTIPAAIICAFLTRWRFKQLAVERRQTRSVAPVETHPQSQAAVPPPNTSLERTRER